MLVKKSESILYEFIKYRLLTDFSVIY